ncbi:MAG: ABC transporter substrate-binding protein [Salinivirgaceae bacterium]|jgi:ABC-type glycerol-3-phosphate transport system substrate-binding protein|nr:ABC transporter substrate-binding protein [Salinivirgaceae bacterium]
MKKLPNYLEFIVLSFCVVIMLVLMFSFVSCNKQEKYEIASTQNFKYKEIKEINWIGHWLNEGNKVELVRDVAREFEFMNQEYLINLKFPEEVYLNNGMSEIDFVVSQLKMDEPDWDIIRLYGNHEEIARRMGDPNWAEKHLVNFSTVPGFMAGHKNFINGDLYRDRNNNKFYGPHTEGQMAALFVNTRVAQKIGIEVKQFGMTFDDFLGYIKAAYEYNQTHGNIVPIFEYNWGKTNTIFNMLFYSLMNNEEEVLNKQITVNKLNAIKQCFEAMEELSKYKPIEQDWISHDWTQENDRILNDECLFFPNMTFMYGIWAENSSEKMKKVIPCEFPVFKPSSIYIGGYLSNWAVLKKSPNKDAAVKLLMHWTRPDIAERWVRLSKSPSGIKGNVASSSFGFDPYENYTHTIDTKYKTLVRDEDKALMVGKDNLHVPIKVQDVLTGQISGKDAFEEFKLQITFTRSNHNNKASN